MIQELDQVKNEKVKSLERLFSRHTAGKYIGDLIYGSNDGIITTFAIVASAAGANLPHLVIIILGLANIVADGISMGASNYLGGKSEKDFAKSQREKEIWEIKNLRDLEVEEVREIYRQKGFIGKDLSRAVEIITSNEKVWVDTMMKDELGIIEDPKDKPAKHGFVTFMAFILAGFIPLLPFFIPNLHNPFLISSIVAAVTLFIVGASRSFVTAVSFFRGGIEMFIVGSLAGTAAYFIGSVVEKFVR